MTTCVYLLLIIILLRTRQSKSQYIYTVYTQLYDTDIIQRETHTRALELAAFIECTEQCNILIGNIVRHSRVQYKSLDTTPHNTFSQVVKDCTNDQYIYCNISHVISLTKCSSIFVLYYCERM